MAKGIDSGLDQLRTIIERNNMHPRRQPGFDLLDFFLYPVNDFLGVLACSRDDHSANRFGAVLDQGRCPECVADFDRAQILKKDGRAVMLTDHHIPTTIAIFAQAPPTHHRPRPLLPPPPPPPLPAPPHHPPPPP